MFESLHDLICVYNVRENMRETVFVLYNFGIEWENKDKIHHAILLDFTSLHQIKE